MNSKTPRNSLRANRRLHFTLTTLAALCAIRVIAPAAGSGKVEAAFALYDKDNDGVVTRAEAGNAPWFDRADENKDGGLTLEEVRRTLGAFIERRGASPPPPAAKPDES